MRDDNVNNDILAMHDLPGFVEKSVMDKQQKSKRRISMI